MTFRKEKSYLFPKVAKFQHFTLLFFFIQRLQNKSLTPNIDFQLRRYDNNVAFANANDLHILLNFPITVIA